MPAQCLVYLDHPENIHVVPYTKMSSATVESANKVIKLLPLICHMFLSVIDVIANCSGFKT